MAMHPDQVYDEIILPERNKCIQRIYDLLGGTSDEYDNLQQVIEESLYAMYHKTPSRWWVLKS